MLLVVWLALAGPLWQQLTVMATSLQGSRERETRDGVIEAPSGWPATVQGIWFIRSELCAQCLALFGEKGDNGLLPCVCGGLCWERLWGKAMLLALTMCKKEGNRWCWFSVQNWGQVVDSLCVRQTNGYGFKKKWKIRQKQICACTKLCIISNHRAHFN